MDSKDSPTPPHVRRQMQDLAAGRDTGPELALRRELWGRGVRGYRVDRSLELPGVRRRADIVWVGRRIAVFIHGCYWHGCPEHGRIPKSNRGYWARKIARNRDRDAETERLAREEGWTVLTFWEHDDVQRAADLVEAVVTGVS